MAKDLLLSTKMDSGEINTRYKIILELLAHYTDSLWQCFLMYFLPHSLLLGFLYKSHFIDKNSVPDWLYLTFSVLGLAACFFWLGGTIRLKNHRDFRFAQARNIEPKSWNIISGDGKDFSDGKEITFIDGTKMHLKWPARIINNIDLYFIIISYTLAYLIIIGDLINFSRYFEQY